MILKFLKKTTTFSCSNSQTGVRSGQPIHQGGDLHVYGKIAALLHLRDHARQAALRHQLCAGSAQRLANACQDFPARSGKKNRPIHQGGDLHVHGEVAALLHLRDHAGQTALRHQLCAGSAQWLANACQDFPAIGRGRKIGHKKERTKCLFFIKCIPEMHITIMSLSPLEKN
jgi:hypothetical protein